MKYLYIRILQLSIIALLIASNVSAVPVGSGFSYQGELNENGQPVNSNRVFTFSLFDAQTGGNQVGPTITLGAGAIPEIGIPVVNGLFNVSDLDFGAQYVGDEYWIEISVKLPEPVGCGPPPFIACPIAELLTPRQRINAVPYAVQADFLGPLGATNGDILKFQGGFWMPTAASAASSPWNVSGSTINYNTGNVGIGIAAPTDLLHVSGPANSGNIFSVDQGGVNKMRLHPDGSIIMSTTIVNNGLTNFANTSLIGKTSIGTPVTNADATHKLTIKAATDNKALRLIGTIGTFGYGARLSFGDLPRVYIEEDTDDHLKIRATGGINLDANVKQPIASNGIMKYMVHLNNCGSTSSLITKFSNNVDTGTITVTNGSIAGECIINFPVDISNRYWQSSAIQPTGSRGVTCSQTGVTNSQLKCTRFDTTTGTGIAGGGIMLLIY